MRNPVNQNKIYYLILFSAAIIYIITAWNSHGYYHADEHYQIIEFAGLKTGLNSADDLAWEYQFQMRPALQPAICIVILKAASFAGITNPYNQAFLLRLLTALMALLFIHYFVKQTEGRFSGEKIKTAYHLFSFLFWMTVLISVRFSSETWSGLFLLLSIAIYLNPKKNSIKPFLFGLALGFSFIIRFQIAFAVLGIFLWLIMIEKKNFYYLLKIASGFVVILIIGFFIDTWFYKAFVFTPWNYFEANIIKGFSIKYGTMPLYYYLGSLIRFPNLIIGIPILFLLIFYFINFPKDMTVWVIIPFVLLHSIIPHKEERFMFPLVYLMPFAIISSYDRLIITFKNKSWIRIVNYFLITLFVLVNTIGLAATSQRAAGTGNIDITKFIHEHYQNARINIIFTPLSNPYNPWGVIPTRFYLEKKMSFTPINNLNEINDSILDKNAENLLIIKKIQANSNVLQEYNFIHKTQSVPVWVEQIKALYNKSANDSTWVLYRHEGI